MALVVPIPQLQQDGNTPSVLVSEKKITLSCSPVTFSDGTSLSVLNKPQSTFLIYRMLLGGVRQVLDVPNKAWTTFGPSVVPQKLFWNDKLQAWQSVIVAIGNKDSSGNDTFGTDSVTGFPLYLAQCTFTGVDSAGTLQTGLSPMSSPVTILAPGQNNVAGLAMDPNDPTKAKDIYLFLKDSSQVERGRIEIFEDSSGFQVQLKVGTTTVVLSDSGQIVLTPSNGQPVQVNGDIFVTGNVSYHGSLVKVP